MLDFWEAGGKRALWVSVGNDLRLDAIRDLSDIRATSIKVYPEVIGGLECCKDAVGSKSSRPSSTPV